MRRGLLVLLSLLWLPACQTLRSFEKSCPGPYSGTRFFNDQVGELPWDGRLFFVLDLPLTLVADTVALPATAFAEPRRPRGGYVVGCRWADRR